MVMQSTVRAMRASVALALGSLLPLAEGHAMTISTTQQQYQLVKGAAGLALTRVEAPVRAPGAGEVLVRVRATALNRRDVMILKGQYPTSDRATLVPLSDGAGEVAAVGSGVTRFKVGDRVAATFFQEWTDGRFGAQAGASALGGAVDGMLAEYVTLAEGGFVALPAHLSFEEGATLPCAGLTAWSGLVTHGRMRAGDWVLLQGTGGVSVFGLQFAQAMGARPIVTSSSDSKLERAKSLGAAAGINYRTTPEWEKALRAVTPAGVDQVLEVGGQGTLAKSLASLAFSGHIAIIGGLSGFGGDLPGLQVLGRGARVTGIMVGSRAEFEAMNAFVAQHGIRPVIDRVFAFAEAQAAFDYMDSGSHFGKVVIRH
jgi:NADPH:quinone reductase-like Zn-dependent oxidoreductase